MTQAKPIAKHFKNRTLFLNIAQCSYLPVGHSFLGTVAIAYFFGWQWSEKRKTIEFYMYVFY